MKRLLIITVMITIAVLVFAQNPEAVIQEMSGTVELKAGNSTDWVPAKPGDRIEQATIVSTGFKSTALLAVGNSTITVRPLTRLSLESLMNQDDVETANIGLHTGRIRVEVKAPAGSKAGFTVQTPTATASVRGTTFDCDSENLKVLEGSVKFEPTAGGNPVMVKAGQNSSIDTVSGKAINPLAQAEKERRLPTLAGQSLTTASHAVQDNTTDNFPGITVKPGNPDDITITVKPKGN